jgi:hypothetical protein
MVMPIKNEREVRRAVQGFKEAEHYAAIGEFVVRFSQLEFFIKSVLASYLKLRDDQFDVIVGPYDFAVLAQLPKRLSS